MACVTSVKMIETLNSAASTGRESPYNLTNNALPKAIANLPLGCDHEHQKPIPNNWPVHGKNLLYITPKLKGRFTASLMSN